jgi:hypothetical protein
MDQKCYACPNRAIAYIVFAGKPAKLACYDHLDGKDS